MWGGVGVCLALVFAPAHMGLPIVREQKHEWQHQLETTRNLEMPRWLSFFFIGLDHQVEHHLFPKIPHQHLPRAAQITAAWCKRHGVTYHSLPYLAALADASQFIRNAWDLEAVPAEVVLAIAVDVSSRLLRDVEGVLLSHEPQRLLVAVRVGVGHRGAAAGEESFVDAATDRMASRLADVADVRRSIEVRRRIPLAERKTGILRAKIGGISPPAAAAPGHDEHVTGQRRIGGGERLRGDGTDLRIVRTGHLPAAGHHQICAFGVVVLAGIDAAHDCQVVHLLRGLREQFRDVQAGDARRNRAERTACRGAGLRIPALELAEAAVHIEHDDALLIALQLIGDHGIGEHAQPAHYGAAGGRGHGAQELPASDPMLRTLACVMNVHGAAPGFRAELFTTEDTEGTEERQMFNAKYANAKCKMQDICSAFLILHFAFFRHPPL